MLTYLRRPHASVRYLVVMQFEMKAHDPYMAANRRIIFWPIPNERYSMAIFDC